MFSPSAGFDIEEITAIQKLFHHIFGRKISAGQKIFEASKIKGFIEFLK
jgi:hypothetical protein